jgi:hypothetical protein
MFGCRPQLATLRVRLDDVQKVPRSVFGRAKSANSISSAELAARFSEEIELASVGEAVACHNCCYEPNGSQNCGAVTAARCGKVWL